MTDFKDFLNQVKIRLTNPLIFSFLISWTIINWRVVIGAFYLNETSLHKLGHNNFLDFISDTIDWEHGFYYPLISAIIYTLVSPVLRLLIQWFNTWINKVGNDKIRKVAKEGFIQYEIYDELLEELQIQRKRNENMLNENIVLTNQLSELKSKYQTIKNENDSIVENNKELSEQYYKTFDNSILNGKWKRTIKYRPDLIQIDEVLINSSRIDIKQVSEGLYSKYYISNFILDKNGTISFVEETIDQQELNELDQIRRVNLLKFNHITNLKKHGNNKFSGNYNKDLTIELELIPD